MNGAGDVDNVTTTRRTRKKRSTIEDGQYVLIQRGEQQRILQFSSQQTINFGKGQGQQDILLRGAAGHQYYSAFRALPLTDEEWSKLKSSTVMRHVEEGGNEGGKGNSNNNKGGQRNRSRKIFGLEKCSEPAAKSFNRQSLLEDLPSSVSSGKDNRNIFDDKSAPSQSLRHADIEVLKDSGLGAKDIVGTILANSTSFAQKTEYSQEKYLKKKENKYGDVLLFLPVDILTLSDYFFKRDAAKVLGLRHDTLSQVLSYGNIRASGRYIVYENAGGIVVAAMLHRMGGFGELLHCHAGTNPQHQAVTFMNFTEEELGPLRNLDVFYLIPGRGMRSKEVNEETEVVSTTVQLENEEPVAKKRRRKDDDNDEEDSEMADEELSKQQEDKPKSKNSREENEKSMELLKTPFDSLIIAAKEHPLSILQRLLPHIGLSCPFVIYCAYAEPLIECYMWAKEKGVGANMHIVDNWLRNIQVETERTHPEINMSSSGGFILYGSYVTNS